MKYFILFLLSFTLIANANGQNIRTDIAANPDLAGGIYTAYMVTEHISAPAPRGYKPFYISHYGRHGSRYQTDQAKYDVPLAMLEQAGRDGRLTDLGIDLLHRVRIIAKDAHLRAGDLSKRGEREQQGIAERMAATYPQVFSGKNGNHITCFSSPYVRNVMSMIAFTERFKEIFPKIQFSRHASFHDIDITRPEKNMYKFFDKARKMAQQYQKEHTKDEAFIRRLFNDYDYAVKLICTTYNSDTTYKFIGNMHDLAMIVQNFDSLPELHDIFTEEERYKMWEFFNIRRYLTYGPSLDFGDIRNMDGKLLLQDIIEQADKIIAGEMPNEVATLRFGHDSAIIPLLAILHIEGCDGRISFAEIERLPEVWCDSYITSMSVNVQFVFYRNRKGDILVKMLHNERDVRLPINTDCFPYYKWNDFRNYCIAQCHPDAQ